MKTRKENKEKFTLLNGYKCIRHSQITGTTSINTYILADLV